MRTVGRATRTLIVSCAVGVVLYAATATATCAEADSCRARCSPRACTPTASLAPQDPGPRPEEKLVERFTGGVVNGKNDAPQPKVTAQRNARAQADARGSRLCDEEGGVLVEMKWGIEECEKRSVRDVDDNWYCEVEATAGCERKIDNPAFEAWQERADEYERRKQGQSLADDELEACRAEADAELAGCRSACADLCSDETGAGATSPPGGSSASDGASGGGGGDSWSGSGGTPSESSASPSLTDEAGGEIENSTDVGLTSGGQAIAGVLMIGGVAFGSAVGAFYANDGEFEGGACCAGPLAPYVCILGVGSAIPLVGATGWTLCSAYNTVPDFFGCGRLWDTPTAARDFFVTGVMTLLTVGVAGLLTAPLVVPGLVEAAVLADPFAIGVYAGILGGFAALAVANLALTIAHTWLCASGSGATYDPFDLLCLRFLCPPLLCIELIWQMFTGKNWSQLADERRQESALGPRPSPRLARRSLEGVMAY